jgi:hypothetical protein
VMPRGITVSHLLLYSDFIAGNARQSQDRALEHRQG